MRRLRRPVLRLKVRGFDHPDGDTTGPVRMAISEDDGMHWSPLEPVGNWGGIVAMASVVPLKTGRDRYMRESDSR